MPNAHPRPHAFTLVELLVTISVIGVLAGLILPLVGSLREQALRRSCGGMLRQWGVALLGYSADNRGMVPGTYLRNLPPIPPDTRNYCKPHLMWATQAKAQAEGAEGQFTFETMLDYLDATKARSGGPSSNRYNVSCPAIKERWRWSGSANYFDLGYPYFGQSQTWNPTPEGTGNNVLGANLLTRRTLEANRLVMLDKVASLSFQDTGLRWLNHGKDRADQNSPYFDGGVPQSLLSGVNALFGDGRVGWYNAPDFNLPPDGTNPNNVRNSGPYESGSFYTGGAEWFFFPISSRW